MTGETIQHTSRPAAKGSTVGRVALAVTALSVVGLIGLYVGSAMGAAGFVDETSSAVSQVVWLCFFLGALAALFVGLVAWMGGRQRGSRFDVRAGQVAVGYFVLAVILFFVS